MRLALCALLIGCGPSPRPTLDSVRWLVVDPYSGYQPTAVNAQGDVYLARERHDTTDIWLAKRSHVDGSLAWETTIPTAGMPHLAADRDGNLLVTGYVLGDSWRAFAAKYDLQGQLAWQSNVALDEAACGLAIAAAPDGRVYVTGGSTGAGNDHFVAAFTFDGIPQWVGLYSDGDNNLPAIAADDSSVTIIGTIVNEGTFGSTMVSANERYFEDTYISGRFIGLVE